MFHQLAALANASVVFMLMLLSSTPQLFGPPTSAPSSESASKSPQNPGPSGDGRVVLVLVDGLRADVARDPAVMPYLCKLAGEGGQGTAEVGSLVPSTVAGIISLSTGRVPPAVSFMEDFSAVRSAQGGLFEAVQRSGGKCVVAGPPLWAELYGPWIASSQVSDSFEGDDGAALSAARRALGGASARWIVVHFLRVDSAAHASGGNSAEYRAAAQWCDGAVRDLVQCARGQTAFVITSDHGVTLAGGHAGREPAVVATPVIVHGPGVPKGELGRMKQSDVNHILRDALRLPPDPVSLIPAPTPQPARAFPLTPLVLLIGIGSTLGLARSANAGAPARKPATLLNIAAWIMLAMIFFQWLAAAVVLGCIALILAIVLSVPAPHELHARKDWGYPSIGPPSALLAGSILSLTRIADGYSSFIHPSAEIVPGWVLALVTVEAFLLGRCVSRLLHLWPLIIGMSCAFLGVALERALLQTASLSSLDMRLAIRLANGPAGLAGAIAVVLITQALPALGLIAGIGPALRAAPERTCGAFLVGLIGVSIGQFVIAAVVLAGSTGATDVSSLALGCFLRSGAELLYWSLGLAAWWLWPAGSTRRIHFA